MQRPEGLARNSDRIVLVLCVVLSLWTMSWDEDLRIERATRWAHWVATPVENVFQFVSDLKDLRAENDELRTRLASLRVDAAYVEARRDRIEELERRAGFYERHRGQLRPATVIELLDGRIPIQAVIRSEEAGMSDLLTAVVSERGLVGRVSQPLSPTTARVQLLTSEESRISVEVIASGAQGILAYDGRRFTVLNLPLGSEVNPGDRVFTSGLGQSVPRGIEVGTVSEVGLATAELFLEVLVDPAVKFDALDRVYLVTRPGPWYFRAGDMFEDAQDSSHRQSDSGEGP
jgi:rod shape-determining protein MreC